MEIQLADEIGVSRTHVR
ncbi:MAG: hypothetical protein LUD41_04720 [Phascolarctobacterium sp.]|nr:hypothetical protein [Phascolarctobacterium sp.]